MEYYHPKQILPLKMQEINKEKTRNKLLYHKSAHKEQNNENTNNLIAINKKFKTKFNKRTKDFNELNENLDINKIINSKKFKNVITNNSNRSSAKIKIDYIGHRNLNQNSNLTNRSSNNFTNNQKLYNNEKSYRENSRNLKNSSIYNYPQKKDTKILFSRKMIKVKYNEDFSNQKQKMHSPSFNNNKKLYHYSNSNEKNKEKNYNIFKNNINFDDEKIKYNRFCKNSCIYLLKKSRKKIIEKLKNIKPPLKNNNIEGISNINCENSKETYYTITNSNKISKYNNTATYFDTSQNQLSYTNNSNSKCSISENMKTSSLIEAFKNIRFNLTQQSKEILELLLKNKSNKNKKSLFTDHMNFLKAEKKINPNLNKEEKLRKIIYDKFLESISKQQEQDNESNFINFNLGATNEPSLSEISLKSSLNKEKTFKERKNEKMIKTQELKVNKNNLFNGESIFSYNDKFLKNIDEFEDGENIKKINNMIFNKFV